MPYHSISFDIVELLLQIIQEYTLSQEFDFLLLLIIVPHKSDDIVYD